MSGFSVAHGAKVRLNLRTASPRRSRSVESWTRTKALKLSNEFPGATSWAGPRNGPTSRRQGIFFS